MISYYDIVYIANTLQSTIHLFAFVQLAIPGNYHIHYQLFYIFTFLRVKAVIEKC